MGNSGFFLMTDDASRNGIALMFLLQAPLLAVAVAAALGGALERARVVGAACCAFLLGFLVYPLLANWIWGGGWLAALGDEFHLGNGFVDVGGAEVIHLTRASSRSSWPSRSGRGTGASAAARCAWPSRATTYRSSSSAASCCSARG
ncbi:MAG: hypothetical protein WDO13_02010 [Verrucomicrobiota bacterium]